MINKKTLIIILIILKLIFFLIGVFIFFGIYNDSAAKESTTQVLPPVSDLKLDKSGDSRDSSSIEEDEYFEDINIPQKYDLVLGEEGAPLTIVEFSSLACPHCADFHATVMPKLKDEYISLGRVRYIYRDFPTNRAASYASVTAFCFQDKRMKMLEILFKTQNMWAFFNDYNQKLNYIVELGNNEYALKCVQSKEIEQALMEKAFINAKKYKIDGTPAFFINNKRYEGDLDSKSFFEFLDTKLALLK